MCLQRKGQVLHVAVFWHDGNFSRLRFSLPNPVHRGPSHLEPGGRLWPNASDLHRLQLRDGNRTEKLHVEFLPGGLHLRLPQVQPDQGQLYAHLLRPEERARGLERLQHHRHQVLCQHRGVRLPTQSELHRVCPQIQRLGRQSVPLLLQQDISRVGGGRVQLGQNCEEPDHRPGGAASHLWHHRRHTHILVLPRVQQGKSRVSRYSNNPRKKQSLALLLSVFCSTLILTYIYLTYFNCYLFICIWYVPQLLKKMCTAFFKILFCKKNVLKNIIYDISNGKNSRSDQNTDFWLSNGNWAIFTLIFIDIHLYSLWKIHVVGRLIHTDLEPIEISELCIFSATFQYMGTWNPFLPSLFLISIILRV